ncbi:MAG: alpha/beta fold hydrolase [Candidatus Roseilinea sp.]|uniref:alpha/beta fold hydrolase n=1 Tax=Candidatus Roseilinea sp. TaxID=2838777 RepID=UPI00404B043D
MPGETRRQQLAHFRATHKPKQIVVDGLTWEYRVLGAGQQWMVVLPGIHGRGELVYELAQAFEQDYRLILPGYPPARRMSQLADGVIAILNAEQIEKAHVLGCSFGGMVAQCLAQRYPDRVGRLILSTTTAPRREPLRRARMLARFTAFLSTEGLKAVMRKSAKRRSFLAASAGELLSAFNARTLACRLLAAADFLGQLPDQGSTPAEHSKEIDDLASGISTLWQRNRVGREVSLCRFIGHRD